MCNLNWIKEYLGDEKAHPEVCLEWHFQRQLDHEGFNLFNGLIPWWLHNLMALLGGGGRWEVTGSMGGGSVFPWPLPILSFLCFLVAMMHYLSMPFLPWWTDTSKIMRQYKWFFLLSCLCLMFCHTNTKITNTPPRSSDQGTTGFLTLGKNIQLKISGALNKNHNYLIGKPGLEQEISNNSGI
jgi:hypothetical protein